MSTFYCKRTRLKMYVATSKSAWDNTPHTVVTVALIFKAIETRHGILKYQLTGKRGKQDVSDARTIAMKLVKEFLPKNSLGKIGLMFNRDHSTVIFNLEKFENLHATDRKFRNQYEALKLDLQEAKV